MALLLRPDLVALGEEPRARNDEEIGVTPDRRRKSRVRAGHAYDLERRGVEYLEARGPVELDRVDAAVWPYRHREPQVPVELTASFSRIVHSADALDLRTPFFF